MKKKAIGLSVFIFLDIIGIFGSPIVVAKVDGTINACDIVDGLFVINYKDLNEGNISEKFEILDDGSLVKIGDVKTKNQKDFLFINKKSYSQWQEMKHKYAREISLIDVLLDYKYGIRNILADVINDRLFFTYCLGGEADDERNGSFLFVYMMQDNYLKVLDGGNKDWYIDMTIYKNYLYYTNDSYIVMQKL